MKHTKQEEYFAPEFEVVMVEVERGFSGSQLPEYKEDDDHIVLG
jgi:hypothetical protein